MVALAWSESPTWYSITKKQTTNISTWALWLTSLDNGHWWIALCHGACSQACCFAYFVCFGTGCTPWELSNKHGAVLFRARQTLDEERSWSHAQQEQPPQSLAWSSPLNPISYSDHSFRKSQMLLSTPLSTSTGWQWVGLVPVSCMDWVSLMDTGRESLLGKTVRMKKCPEEESHKTKWPVCLTDQYGMQALPWISDTFCFHFKESMSRVKSQRVNPCKRGFFCCCFLACFFYIWESIYRCCLGFILLAEALRNRSLKIHNFLCENVHHICLCSEELDLICSSAEGCSEGKSITPPKHCKQRHPGVGGVLGGLQAAQQHELGKGWSSLAITGLLVGHSGQNRGSCDWICIRAPAGSNAAWHIQFAERSFLYFCLMACGEIRSVVWLSPVVNLKPDMIKTWRGRWGFGTHWNQRWWLISHIKAPISPSVIIKI